MNKTAIASRAHFSREPTTNQPADKDNMWSTYISIHYAVEGLRCRFPRTDRTTVLRHQNKHRGDGEFSAFSDVKRIIHTDYAEWPARHSHVRQKDRGHGFLLGSFGGMWTREVTVSGVRSFWPISDETGSYTSTEKTVLIGFIDLKKLFGPMYINYVCWQCLFCSSFRTALLTFLRFILETTPY